MHDVPDTNHGVVLTDLFLFLGRAQEAGFGEVFTSPSAVALDCPARGDASIYVSHPDLFFVVSSRGVQLRGRRRWEGVPDLIIEVLSPSTHDEHRPGGRLWDAYEQHGVPHYWLADPVQRVIQQYVLTGEPFQSGRYLATFGLTSGALLTSLLFPTIPVPVEYIFRRVRDRAS